MAGTRSAADGVARTGRERILEAAYPLFSRSGIRAVGVDKIVAAAGVAKMTLYRNFPSKDELALAFLAMREERWTRAWLWEEVRTRAEAPGDRLLAIFDVFGEWFEREDFEGCSFINVLLEQDDQEDPVRAATVTHLANIRELIQELARDAGIEDTDAFSRQWHILMKGSIVAAGEGDRLAARRARELGTLLLERLGVPLSR
jgi:AcrR family transcriptional regulator